MTPIRTRVGRAEHGENHFCGHAVRGELTGRAGWASLISLAVGSRMLSDEDARLLEDAAVCTLAADPRIWPLKVTRLVSSYGGTLAGFCAGHLLLEGAIMGPWPTGLAAAFLTEIKETLQTSWTSEEQVRRYAVDQIASGRKLPGFGVPFRPADERLLALRECLQRRGRDAMPFWTLAMQLDAIVFETKKIHANQSLALAAVFLDLGFTVAQIPVLTTSVLDLCFYANAVEEASLRSPQLQRLPADCIEYIGQAPRLSPRAEAKRALDSQAPVLAEPSFR